MISEKRKDLITNMIKSEGFVNVSDLSIFFKVSKKTIRLDLAKLEQDSIVKRVHGGAKLSAQDNSNASQSLIRHNRNWHSKQKIARKALELIEHNDFLILDDGSTTLALAKLLGDFPVTVFTNDMIIAAELMPKSNVLLFIVGGNVKKNGNSYIISGSEAINFIQKFKINKLFLGTSTLSIDDGLMIFSYGDTEIKQVFMECSDQVYCLADSSKFEKKAFIKHASLSQLDGIITDDEISDDLVRRYSDAVIKIIVAS